MSPTNVTLSRLDCLFLAKVADQAERYQDVIAQLKQVIAVSDIQLTIDERNLLSIAYKNITAAFRASWRSIDTLQRAQMHHLPRQEIVLMDVQKERIEDDIATTCKDVLGLLESYLIPSAETGEEKVFYCKMRGDYYRYLAEASRGKSREEYASTSLEAYKFAYKHALNTLDPAHPTRLGLALNFAVYYHDILQSPERACYLAKHAFDEAVSSVTDPMFTGQILEDSLMILHLLKDDLILWSSEFR
ncbi:14-3-3-like protein [Obba rivulosa]|uniref:14-3-3-like protein n=1 Tax=Obba rivulosa TaxID=1052685 RepID=A0A8E2AZ92_9APHY|nr:14-3-3-like protein [Obba rivulosa]